MKNAIFLLIEALFFVVLAYFLGLMAILATPGSERATRSAKIGFYILFLLAGGSFYWGMKSFYLAAVAVRLH